MITRLALYATLGIVLGTLELTFDTTGFWLIMLMYWAMDQLSRRQGFEDGIVMTAMLPIKDLERIQQEIREIEEEYKDKE